MAKFSETPVYSQRFIDALFIVAKWHEFQIRKGGAPYFAHLMSVSALVFEAGGSEEEAIAALCHDAHEDIGISLEQIEKAFGRLVAIMVSTLSEDKTLPKLERKEKYVNAIRNCDLPTALISLCDKLHNAKSYLNGAIACASDESQQNPGQVLWFYGKLFPVFLDRFGGDNFLVIDLYDVLFKLNRVWGRSIPTSEMIGDLLIGYKYKVFDF